MANICSVCGYDGLYDPSINERGISSDEICPCCGFHYGYDDDDVEDKKKVYKIWSEKWINKGYVWFSTGRKAPINWDPIRQLKNVNH